MTRSGNTPRSYLRPYHDAAAQHGPTFGALLWRNRDFQTLRFDVLAREARLAGRAVADLGCGTGDMLRRLVEAGQPPRSYVGVEGIASLAQRARAHTASAGVASVEILEADFVADERFFEKLVRQHGVDAMVFSGSLNTLSERLARRTLERAWRGVERSRDGVLAFNFLASEFRGAPTDDHGPAKRFSCARLLAWAMKKTDRVVLRTDYLDGHDATIVMFVPSA
ncbi:MAG: class I SAM-dependent methyltransferase [Phycisphaerales bacterium]|jgi:SAM-dependent methyltransferase|nr:class I SAM-dependent methyltransferase [Phycisphaerales bacterium]